VVRAALNGEEVTNVEGLRNPNSVSALRAEGLKLRSISHRRDNDKGKEREKHPAEKLRAAA
jgi:hypothetical protein